MKDIPDLKVSWDKAMV